MMTTRLLGPRYEIKLTLPPGLRPWLRHWLRTSAAHWRRSYPPRWVNSLYFDDGRATALRANLEGWGRREKIRLRWYGEELGFIEEGQLEIKARRGRTGIKRVERLPDLHCDLRRARWVEVLERLRHFQAARRALLRYPSPALIVRYRRAYYVSRQSDIRLTVDEQIVSFEQGLAPRPNLRYAHPRPVALIVELKAPPSQADALARWLNEMPCRPTRHSKYASGRLAFLRGSR